MADQKDSLVVGIESSVAFILEGRMEQARETLAALPAPPVPVRLTVERTVVPARPAKWDGLIARRTPPKPLYLDTFFSDSFRCRYCGRHTIFGQVLSALSKLFPAEFPTHPNWKFGECHPAYWSHWAALEHVVPIARGGSPDNPRNLVTACYACQQAKLARTLEELGWGLRPLCRCGGSARSLGVRPAATLAQ